MRGDFYRIHGQESWNEYDLTMSPVTLDAAYQDRLPAIGARSGITENIRPPSEVMDLKCRVLSEVLLTRGIDYSIASLTREGAKQEKVLWVKVLRGCEPDSQLSRDATTVLAWSAWLSGDGAMAGQAVDLSDKSEVYSQMIQKVLRDAVDSNTWPGS